MNFRPPSEQEEKRKQETAQLLETARIYLLNNQPFIGAILLRQNLVPVADSRCPTASTDGQNIFVNPDFYLPLKPAQRLFVLAHEVWHTVYLHFLRRGNRDRDRFNIATDMEINHMLLLEDFKAPAGALLPPPQWRGFNAEQIYDHLPENNLLAQPFDVHLEPSDIPVPGAGLPLPPDDPAEGKETAEQGCRAQQPCPADGPAKGKDIVIDPDFQVDFGDHPEEQIAEKVIEAAVFYEKQRGFLPGNIARVVETFRSGKLHWKELLAQFVTSCFGGSRRWLPPNRRFISGGLYLQSRRDSKLQAVLAIDTSGSTCGDLPRFADELVNLLNSFGQYELTVICCDAKIQSVETYTADFPFDARMIQFKGWGGTSFIPVFDYMKNHPSEAQILIYFTDGYGDCPQKPPYPVMWVITPDGQNRVPWGYEIKLDRES